MESRNETLVLTLTQLKGGGSQTTKRKCGAWGRKGDSPKKLKIGREFTYDEVEEKARLVEFLRKLTKNYLRAFGLLIRNELNFH